MGTLVFTGRPVRVKKSPYAEDWEKNRQAEIKELTSRGIVPFEKDLREEKVPIYQFSNTIMGQAVGGIKEVKPAGELVQEMIRQALEVLEGSQKFVSRL